MLSHALPIVLLSGSAGLVSAQSTTVPTDIQMPGTQPEEVAVESANRCDNCHFDYDAAVEPVRNWWGGMMAQAARDPLFWATVAVAEHDFPGSGDLCIRCHSPEGWTEGRSTPTDGSDLRPSDSNGVSCDVCHQLTNPDDSEHLGVQNTPFLANDEGTPRTGYYGNGMYVLDASSDKLGPYSDPASPHQALPSDFHRSSELCGTCHDVSNPAVGDLAHNNGAMTPLSAGTFSGVPGAAVEDKAAFNNFPYEYGVTERTFSEHVASDLSSLVRPEVEIHRPAAERAKGAMAALGQLLFVLPEDPETWVQAEWPERIRTAIRERRVVEEMTREQVLLAWGTPLYLSGDEETGTQVWTYQHGATLREQLRNRSRVYLVLGTVVQVEEDR
jgi:hypothetical protein